jgi:selenide,water dikinase
MYGAVAAANAMSDIYAMGGDVVLALNVAALPLSLPTDYLAEILRGGADKVKEAGGVIAGGHTIQDIEPKYGLSVTGFVHPDLIWTKGGALPGDALVLTKPLGTSMIVTADRLRIASQAHVMSAVSMMAQLNRDAAEALKSIPEAIHAVTDITGFALLGHSLEVAEQSSACMRFDFSRLPFVEGALEYASRDCFCTNSKRNRDYYGHRVRFGSQVSVELQNVLFSPESSGGLLVSVESRSVGRLEAALLNKGQAYWVIGEVVHGDGIEVL